MGDIHKIAALQTRAYELLCLEKDCRQMASCYEEEERAHHRERSRVLDELSAFGADIDYATKAGDDWLTVADDARRREKNRNAQQRVRDRRKTTPKGAPNAE
jgi:hypothetical protein